MERLGWREIEVVDKDLGRSAAGIVTRAGFEHMVAEVCLTKVDVVAARELSRFCAPLWGEINETLPMAGGNKRCGNGVNSIE